MLTPLAFGPAAMAPASAGRILLYRNGGFRAAVFFAVRSASLGRGWRRGRCSGRGLTTVAVCPQSRRFHSD